MSLADGHGRRSFATVLALFLLGSAPGVLAAYVPGDDLPGPPTQNETIPAGSLVIPMDNTLQALVAPFNLKSYGLVHDLLLNGIPVKWAIRAGKAKDGIDFTATARKFLPLPAGAPASFNFSGGPFIIHKDFVQLAMPRITAFGSSVAVYELTADATVDVRYDLTLKPNIAVSNDNTAIHTDLLDAAGIPSYTVINPIVLSATSCYTSHSEPHTTEVAGIPAVKAFVQTGGNFLAQCKASITFEDSPGGFFQTTLGTAINNKGNALTHPSPDLAFSQFVGILDPAPGGSEQDWRLAAGSVFQNGGHVHALNVGIVPDTYAATAAKLYNGKGGMVFYLGGHEYKDATIESYNGRRMYLNFVFVPTTRPASCNLDFEAQLRTIAGRVYEDVNGDSGLGDAAARPGVTVRLYRDTNASGTIDAGDVWLNDTTTSAAGAYSFRVSTAASGNFYLLAVDSRSLAPAAGLNGGFAQGDVWAEQTYGDDPGTAPLDLGPRFGGRSAGLSDAFTAATAPASNTYEHVARLDVSAGNPPSVDFAFSFNAVTSIRGLGADDDDASANRTVQGSLRQFLQNAAAIAGANTMRFVPAPAPNASGGGGSWWQLGLATVLPAVTDAGTTIDGTAYSTTDGVTVRDDNPGALGAGGSVGVDAIALPQVNKPELELVDGAAGLPLGLDINAGTTTVRSLAIYGFGTDQANAGHGTVRVSGGSGILLERNVIGASAASFADPGASRTVGQNVRVVGGAGTIRDNLIGFAAGSGIDLSAGSGVFTVSGNELRGNGRTCSSCEGLVAQTSGHTVQQNLVIANRGSGLDLYNATSALVVRNNTVTGNGIANPSDETAGIRTGGGAGGTIDRNVIVSNYGAGVLVPSAASGMTISRNSIYLNGSIVDEAGGAASGQLGIDLLAASDAQARGTAPYVTLDDSGDADSGGNGLMNYPVLTSAVVAGARLTVTGFARPGATIEVFVVDPDPTGFGEGKTFLFAAAEGGGSDLDARAGSFGPAAVNGLAQGTDATNRFTFSVATPPAVTQGTVLTATATDGSGSTSEFSGRVTVGRPAIVKRALRTDGTPLPDGVVAPRGSFVKFLLYVNNPGDVISDLSVDDVLDPGFAYVAESIRFANTTGTCADLACTAGEESAIFAAADGGTVGTDAVDGDVVGFASGAVRAGNQTLGNAQLDLAASKVWAMVFTVKVR